MFDLAPLLHAAVATACPIDGVSVGDPSDKTTWRIDFGIGATDAQKTAARQAVVAFDPAMRPTEIDVLAFYGRFTNAERVAAQIAINASPQLGVGLVNGLARGRINLIDQVTADWMAGLVLAGALTADRKTAILIP